MFLGFNGDYCGTAQGALQIGWLLSGEVLQDMGQDNVTFRTDSYNSLFTD